MTEPAPPPPPARSRWDAGRIVLLVLGILATLFALAVLAAAGALFWANSQRDSDGYFRTGAHNFSTPSFPMSRSSDSSANEGVEKLCAPVRK